MPLESDTFHDEHDDDHMRTRYVPKGRTPAEIAQNYFDERGLSARLGNRDRLMTFVHGDDGEPMPRSNNT